MVDSDDRQSVPAKPASPSLWEEPAPKRRPGLTLLIIVLAVVVLCIGAFVAAVFMAYHSANQVPTP
jgi:flagellar basal body-associated protein FliL